MKWALICLRQLILEWGSLRATPCVYLLISFTNKLLLSLFIFNWCPILLTNRQPKRKIRIHPMFQIWLQTQHKMLRSSNRQGYNSLWNWGSILYTAWSQPEATHQNKHFCQSLAKPARSRTFWTRTNVKRAAQI